MSITSELPIVSPRVPPTASAGERQARPAAVTHGGRSAVILVVDDDEGIREVLSSFLKLEGFRVLTAPHGVDALRTLAQQPVSLVVSDVDMPIMDGLTLLDELKRLHPEEVTLMSTGDDRAQTVVEAMKRGAFDYVVKPFKIQDVIQTVGRALEHQRLQAENIELQGALALYRLADELQDETCLETIVTVCAETFRVQARADRVSIVLADGGEGDERAWGAGIGPRLGRTDLTSAARAVQHATLASEGRVHRFIESTEKSELISSLVISPLHTSTEHLGWLVAVRDAGRPFSEGDRKLATILAERLALSVHNARLAETLEDSFRSTIQAFVTSLEEKDEYTAGHSERVADYARLTAQALGLSAALVEQAHQGGRLHDIGKLPLPDELLNKPGPLTSQEYEALKRHTTYGYELLRPIPFFQALLPAVWSHHERWDGRGYPQGLAGEEIPLTARIMAVADSYDAMTSDRAYRKAMTHEDAVHELRRCAGRQFDPKVVDAFLSIFRA